MLIYDPKTGKTIEKNAAAGVVKSVGKNLGHENFRNTLFRQEDCYVKQKTIKSFNHDIFTVEQYKCGLTAYCDKRYLLPGGLKSRAFGHWRNAM